MISAKLKRLMKLVKAEATELELQTSVDLLLEEVRDAMLSNADQTVLARYIQYLQINCTEVMDAAKTGVLVRQSLRMLLLSLRKYYPQFYNHDALVPILIAEQGLKTLEKRGELRHTKLKARMRDRDLFDIVTQYFNDLQLAKSFSYVALDKQLALQEQMILFCAKANFVLFDEQLMDYLVELDFRDSRFLDYYMDQISTALAGEAQLEIQYAILSGYQKRILKTQMHGSSIGSDQGTYAVLIAFVNELLTINANKLAYLSAAEMDLEPTEFQKDQSYRLKTVFSVDVLSYLFRLYVECGYVKISVKNQLFRFLATKFQTAKTENRHISTMSIRNKYNLVLQSTALQTRNMLMKMVNQIDLEFRL